MKAEEIDPKEVESLLELARESERSAREMCETITNHARKYEDWYEKEKSPVTAIRK